MASERGRLGRMLMHDAEVEMRAGRPRSDSVVSAANLIAEI